MSNKTKSVNNFSKSHENICFYCQKSAASITVRRLLPHRRTKRAPLNVCLLHYYSTAAVREDAKSFVSVQDSSLFSLQLPVVQAKFADAVSDLQKKLRNESANAFEVHGSDPLGILTKLHEAPERTTENKVRRQNQRESRSGGGFVRNTSLPDRFLRIQAEQDSRYENMTKRVFRATDISRRRKSSRKSIWNTIIDEDRAPTGQKGDFSRQLDRAHLATCDCGSDQVVNIFSKASNDSVRGEIWGSKDNDYHQTTVYQCLSCGKRWDD